VLDLVSTSRLDRHNEPDRRPPDVPAVRHNLPSMRVLASAATLAGACSLSSIEELAVDCTHEMFTLLGGKHHPGRKCYVTAPAEILPRALSPIALKAVDRLAYPSQFTHDPVDQLSRSRVTLTRGGKPPRGTLRENDQCVYPFFAIVHVSTISVANNEIENKPNDITSFQPILGILRNITRILTTIDEIHIQRDSARLVVQKHYTHFLLPVKDDQPNPLALLMAIPEEQFSAKPAEITRNTIIPSTAKFKLQTLSPTNTSS